MYNSQGSSKDLFSRINSRMDGFGSSLSQDWFNSLSQDSRSLPVTCTPSNILGFQSSSESTSQQNLPQYKWGPTNPGTTSYSGMGSNENQMSRKIWFGLTAVFKVVSELVKMLEEMNIESLHRNNAKYLDDITANLTVLFKRKADELEPLISELKLFKEQKVDTTEQLKEVHDTLHVLNSKITEFQELFDKFQKSFQEDLNKKTGTVIKKLSLSIRDFQTWITDFQKVQNHNLSVQYEEISSFQKEIMAVIKDLPSVKHFAELDRKLELKFDNIGNQLLDMKTIITKLSDVHSNQIVKVSEVPRSNIRNCSQNQIFPKSSSTPLNKVIKISPVARVLPLHTKSEVRNFGNTFRSAKRNFDVGFADRNAVTTSTNTKNNWCELTQDWVCFMEREIPPAKKIKMIQSEPKVVRQTSSYKPKITLQKTEITSCNTSFEDDQLFEVMNNEQMSFNQEKFSHITRPRSRITLSKN